MTPERAKLQLKNGWHNKLRNRSTSLRKTVSMPEVILQSTFSRTVISLSKQKWMNAHGHNSATSFFDDETSGAFYSWELTLPRGANNSILKKVLDNVPFLRSCHIGIRKIWADLLESEKIWADLHWNQKRSEQIYIGIRKDLSRANWNQKRSEQI